MMVPQEFRQNVWLNDEFFETIEELVERILEVMRVDTAEELHDSYMVNIWSSVLKPAFEVDIRSILVENYRVAAGYSKCQDEPDVEAYKKCLEGPAADMLNAGIAVLVPNWWSIEGGKEYTLTKKELLTIKIEPEK